MTNSLSDTNSKSDCITASVCEVTSCDPKKGQFFFFWISNDVFVSDWSFLQEVNNLTLNLSSACSRLCLVSSFSHWAAELIGLLHPALTDAAPAVCWLLWPTEQREETTAQPVSPAHHLPTADPPPHTPAAVSLQWRLQDASDNREDVPSHRH